MGAVPLRLDADNPNEVDSGVRPATSTFIAASVGTPQEPQQLLIFTGNAIINFELPAADQDGTPPEQARFEIILEKNLASSSDFLGSTTYASLASINNDTGDDDSFEYRVVEVKTLVRPDGALRLSAEVEVGNDAVLLRMSYQVTVLANAPH